MKKRIFLGILLCISILLFCACGEPVEQTGDKSVVDMVGRTVIVPEDPQQICALNPFCAPFVVSFGHGENMKATVNAIKRDVLIQAICPSLQDAVVVKSSGSVNAEAVLALGVDLIFLEEGTYTNDDERAKLDALNIPYLVLKNNTIEEAMESVLLMGEVLNAKEKAEQYVAYYRSILQEVEQIVATIPEEERPDLYHSVNEATRTDFPGSITAEWVAHSGVNNVSLDSDKLNLSGDSAYTTLEQIFVWDPEIIICNEPGVANYILTDSKWVGLQAVTEQKVYQMPVGITRWGHPNSTETPLALIWLVETIYPDYFEYDLEAETKEFYQTFFGYELDDEMLAAVLAGDGMRTPKTNNKNE